MNISLKTLLDLALILLAIYYFHKGLKPGNMQNFVIGVFFLIVWLI